MSRESLIQERSLFKRYRWFLFAGISFIVFFVLVSNSEGVARAIDARIGPDPQLSWPTVLGTILSSDLRCEQRQDGEGDWMFDVKFHYQVQGAQFSAQQQLIWYELLPYDHDDPEIKPFQLGCGMLFGGRPDTLAIIDKMKYRPGQAVIVYFNPSDPSYAVIEPGVIFGTNIVTRGEIISLVKSLIPCLGGVVLFYAGILGLRK